MRFNIKAWIRSLPHKLREYIRIIKIARKPTKEEFTRIAKITGAGIVIIGLIGFIVQAVYNVVTHLV